MPNETIDTTADNTIGNNSNDKTVNDRQWELEKKKIKKKWNNQQKTLDCGLGKETVRLE